MGAKEMNVKIYAVFCGYEKLIGTAIDKITAVSLIMMAEKMGSYAVSLHGTYKNEVLSGEMLIKEAENFFLNEWTANDFYAA